VFKHFVTISTQKAKESPQRRDARKAGARPGEEAEGEEEAAPERPKARDKSALGPAGIMVMAVLLTVLLLMLMLCCDCRKPKLSRMLRKKRI
jgi:hypothetical protein